MRRLEELHRNWRLGRPRSQRMMLADCDLRKLDLSLMDFTDAATCAAADLKPRPAAVVFATPMLTRQQLNDEADLTRACSTRYRRAIFAAAT